MYKPCWWTECKHIMNDNSTIHNQKIPSTPWQKTSRNKNQISVTKKPNNLPYKNIRTHSLLRADLKNSPEAGYHAYFYDCVRLYKRCGQHTHTDGFINRTTQSIQLSVRVKCGVFFCTHLLTNMCSSSKLTINSWCNRHLISASRKRTTHKPRHTHMNRTIYYFRHVRADAKIQYGRRVKHTSGTWDNIYVTTKFLRCL